MLLMCRINVLFYCAFKHATFRVLYTNDYLEQTLCAGVEDQTCQKLQMMMIWQVWI
jgi:hypothetical protein